VVFVDFWLMKKFGLRPYYAEASGKSFNWAAGLTWMITLLACVALVKLQWVVDQVIAIGILDKSDAVQAFVDQYTVQIFFVSLPGWFVAAVLYLVLSRLYQKKEVMA